MPHVVRPGETLSGIASADGLSAAQLAAANGLSPLARLTAGATVELPPGGASGSSAGGPVAADGAAPGALGGYTVHAGDTLSAIAVRVGSSPSQIAWMNGLSLSSPLMAGTALKLPTSTAAPVTASTPPAEATNAPPYAGAGRVTSAEVGSIAVSEGVPAALAEAIAWQESGFSNAAVSPANARGVMQVMPGTWTWIQDNLTGSPLDPASTADNVRAGVLYLRELLRDTGGNEQAAVAAYYQGLGSVRATGMLAGTQRYVANVFALKLRFGG